MLLLVAGTVVAWLRKAVPAFPSPLPLCPIRSCSSAVPQLCLQVRCLPLPPRPDSVTCWCHLDGSEIPVHRYLSGGNDFERPLKGRCSLVDWLYRAMLPTDWGSLNHFLWNWSMFFSNTFTINIGTYRRTGSIQALDLPGRPDLLHYEAAEHVVLSVLRQGCVGLIWRHLLSQARWLQRLLCFPLPLGSVASSPLYAPGILALRQRDRGIYAAVLQQKLPKHLPKQLTFLVHMQFKCTICTQQVKFVVWKR